jgi:hypothetical protein
MTLRSAPLQMRSAPIAPKPGAIRRSCGCGGHSLGGVCDACRPLGASLDLGRPATAANAVAEALASPGAPLDPTTRRAMEERFAHDFSNVRVHVGTKAAIGAKALNARAYTVGGDIVFGAGRFTPHTQDGRRLLAHELTHVVQNARGAPRARSLSQPQDPAEREAKRQADNAVGGHPVHVGEAPAALVQADIDPGVAVGIGVGAAAGLGLGIAWLAGAFDSKPKAKAGPSLDDPVFKAKWDEALKESLARMKAVQADGGCRFPASRNDIRYDEKNWDVVTTSDDLKFRTYRFKPKAETPLAGAAALWDNLDRWNCDCRLFGEVALLLAWYRALQQQPDAFNSKFAGLMLSAEDTTGLERTKLQPEEMGDEVDPATWDSAPVGSKVVWRNESPYAKPPWTHEHAIKSRMAGGGKPALYAAGGIGFDVTEDDIKPKIAAACLPDYPYSWTVTDDTIAACKAAGYADADSLGAIKGKPFKYLKDFIKQDVFTRLNGKGLEVPLPDTRPAPSNKLFYVLIKAVEPTEPPPDDPDVQIYIRTNNKRDKVERFR